MRNSSSPAISDVRFGDQARTTALLSKRGTAILARLVDAIRRTAMAREWPLRRLDIRNTQDPELAAWEYVTVTLVFDASFEMADRWLHEIYPFVEDMLKTVSAQDRLRLNKTLFFDVDVRPDVQGS